MKRKGLREAVFKANHSNQLSLLPPSLDELIPKGHVVRVVNEVLDKVDLKAVINRYKGGGTSSYHPRMMLKVLVYGYLRNIYSSRKLEAIIGSDIHFMWLAGMQRPDHNTLNRFRSDRLKGVLKQVFAQVVMFLVEEGVVSLDCVFTDGTKMEANANRYTFVWRKSVARNRNRIKGQLEELWSYAERVAKSELEGNFPDGDGAGKLSSEQVDDVIDRINNALKAKPSTEKGEKSEKAKKIKQKLNYAKRNWPKKIIEYDKKEKLLDGRNSYSKTDPDATFMRMKEDHMKNGQLKAGYNWQISTSGQFILNYGIYQNATDFGTLPSHVEEFKALYGELPKKLVADAGYGSEENYAFLEKESIDAYVKYGMFHKEQKKKHKENPFHPDNLYYNKEEDFLVCPMGQRMDKRYETKRKTKNGFEQTLSVYRALNCQGCPMRGQCHKSKEDRQIQRNHNLLRYKKMMREKLLSEEGDLLRKQRSTDVETPFGNIKHNKKFRRFGLRGTDKVLIEAGLLALSTNLAKLTTKRA